MQNVFLLQLQVSLPSIFIIFLYYKCILWGNIEYDRTEKLLARGQEELMWDCVSLKWHGRLYVISQVRAMELFIAKSMHGNDHGQEAWWWKQFDLKTWPWNKEKALPLFSWFSAFSPLYYWTNWMILLLDIVMGFSFIVPYSH